MSQMTFQNSSRSASTIWQQFREQMPVVRKWAYFDHAAVSPLPQLAFDKISKWADEALTDGDAFWTRWSRQYEELRNLASQLINCTPDEIGLVPNTSFGINMVAEGFPWKPGDNVVLPAGEFPSNVYPWMHLADRGVTVRTVPLDGYRVCPNRLAEACDSRTRIVSASWVGYASGYRLDPYELAKVAHDQGALFFLDAIQGMGVFPLDVQRGPIDFLAADGHKWMLGPEGAGIFYVKREHLKLLRPINVGWNSVSQGNDYSRVELNIREAASRYESGSQNLVGFIGLLGSLQTLHQFGLRSDESPIGTRVIAVTDDLCTRLNELGLPIYTDRTTDDVKSGIVSFEVPGFDSLTLKSQLHAEGVVVSCRAGRLRIAAHAYNNDEDLDRLIVAIKKLSGR